MSTKSIVQDNFKDLLIETSNPKFDNELREGNVLSLLTNDNQYIEIYITKVAGNGNIKGKDNNGNDYFLKIKQIDPNGDYIILNKNKVPLNAISVRKSNGKEIYLKGNKRLVKKTLSNNENPDGSEDAESWVSSVYKKFEDVVNSVLNDYKDETQQDSGEQQGSNDDKDPSTEEDLPDEEEDKISNDINKYINIMNKLELDDIVTMRFKGIGDLYFEVIGVDEDNDELLLRLRRSSGKANLQEGQEFIYDKKIPSIRYNEDLGGINIALMDPQRTPLRANDEVSKFKLVDMNSKSGLYNDVVYTPEEATEYVLQDPDLKKLIFGDKRYMSWLKGKSSPDIFALKRRARNYRVNNNYIDKSDSVLFEALDTIEFSVSKSDKDDKIFNNEIIRSMEYTVLCVKDSYKSNSSTGVILRYGRKTEGGYIDIELMEKLDIGNHRYDARFTYYMKNTKQDTKKGRLKITDIIKK